MSRMGGSDQIVVRPANNVYTVLAAVAVLVQLLALVIFIVQSGSVFGESLFFPSGGR